MPDETPLLHVYGQEAWHDPVHIVGTAFALERLIHALRIALDEGRAALICETADGEGYPLGIYLTDEDDVKDFCLPYAKDFAKSAEDIQPNPLWPHKPGRTP